MLRFMSAKIGNDAVVALALTQQDRGIGNREERLQLASEHARRDRRGTADVRCRKPRSTQQSLRRWLSVFGRNLSDSSLAALVILHIERGQKGSPLSES